MRKYLALLKRHLSVSIDYRADLLGTIIMELLSVGSAVILWFAIYRSNNSVGGYSLDQIVLYYVLVPFVGFFTYVNISRNLGWKIIDGSLSNQLIKPYRIWLDSFTEAVASKVVYIFVALPIYGVLVYVMSLRNLLPGDFLEAPHIAAGVLVIVLAFSLHFVLDFFITCLAFWFHDVWSFKHFKQILFAILGGVRFPLELLPPGWRFVFDLLPFRFFYYTPISTLLGKNASLGKDLVMIGCWFCVFVVLCSVFWKKGIKKYEAYGN